MLNNYLSKGQFIGIKDNLFSIYYQTFNEKKERLLQTQCSTYGAASHVCMLYKLPPTSPAWRLATQHGG